MSNLEPINQNKLFGLDNYINELIKLDIKKNLPNKILLSGTKGIGKSTLAYHFINYILSKNEDFKYDTSKFEININNQSFKTTLNKSNPNLIVVNVVSEKKFIEIDQIRKVISNLNKSSFNNKPRFVLIDNIEFLNKNSVNALLKILEEPSTNVHFILINNNKKILSTLLSRCINFKISLSNKQCLIIAEKLLNNNIRNLLNDDLINYYATPGDLFYLVKFAQTYDYDLSKLNLKELLRLIIKNNHYKKDDTIKYLIYNLVEFYLRKISLSFSSNILDKYSFFIKEISNFKKYNLDEESLLMSFEEQILNE